MDTKCQCAAQGRRETTDVGDDPMNGGAGKAVSMLSGGKFTEVARRYGGDVVKQPKDDTTNVPAINRDVKLRETG